MTCQEVGELKTGIAVEKVDILKAAVPETKKANFEEVKLKSQDDWRSFVFALMETK